MLALKNTRTRLDETNEIHDEGGIYGRRESPGRDDFGQSTHARARSSSPSSPFPRLMLTTCVSRRVKTCHARFAARKASFGSKKVAGF